MKRSVKITMAAALLASGLIGFTIGVRASDGIKLIANGKTMNVDLRLLDNKSFVPLRDVSEILGAAVEWNDAERTVYIQTHIRASGDPVYEAGPLTLHNVSVLSGEYGWSITAEAFNASTNTYRAVNMTAVFRDNQGNRIGTATGTVFDLDPGDAKTVRFATTDDLAKYETVTFQTDFVY